MSISIYISPRFCPSDKPLNVILKVAELIHIHEYIKSFLMLTISLAYCRDYKQLIFRKHTVRSIYRNLCTVSTKIKIVP